MLLYPKRNWQYKFSYENRKAIKELHHFTDKLTFATQNKIVTLEDVEDIRKTKKEDLQDAYNYRNRLYYARSKTENKEEFFEKIAQVTAYISKLKYELRMCGEIEDEISKIIEQIKEKDNRENNFDKKIKRNKFKSCEQKNEFL